MQSDEQALLLHSRLNSFGQSCAQGAESPCTSSRSRVSNTYSYRGLITGPYMVPTRRYPELGGRDDPERSYERSRASRAITAFRVLVQITARMQLFNTLAISATASVGSSFGAARQATLAMSAFDGRNKVVVTGIGALTSLGQDADTIFEELLAGKCGIGPLTLFDPKKYPPVPQIASEVQDFDISKFWSPPPGRPSGVGFDPDKYDRYIHFAIAAATSCLLDGGFNAAEMRNRYRFGCNIASGAGGIGKLERSCRDLFCDGEDAVSGPDALGVSNTASQIVAMEVGACGPNANFVSACASGTHALGEAYRNIAFGEADVMLAGGTEACITPLTISGFTSMRAMCTTGNSDPQKASRPFDAERCGFVMGGTRAKRCLALCLLLSPGLPCPCPFHRGCGCATARVGGARDGARRPNLLRARGLRGELRRVPHHGPAPRG